MSVAHLQLILCHDSAKINFKEKYEKNVQVTEAAITIIPAYLFTKDINPLSTNISGIRLAALFTQLCTICPRLQ
jgi:hypothetical protein